MNLLGFVILVLAIFAFHYHVESTGVYSWMSYDRFDEIDARYRSVNADNCRSKSKEQLMLPADVVSQIPVYNQLLSRVWYRNRTSLIHLHNMALNRAFFNSYILQRMNDSATFTKQPSWLYYYFSAAADVNANPSSLNGSAFYFDTDCHYPNWYTTLAFNKTIPLFAPKAYRWDDFRDQDNFLREPSLSVVKVEDAGAGTYSNYTHPAYKMNPWYSTWMPDVFGERDSLMKFTYYIGIKQSNTTGKFTTNTYQDYAFFGPASPGARETDKKLLPVQFTAPYFDCGGANRWIVSAVSPVVDFMPRYSNYTHLRRSRFIGVIAMSIAFSKIDFNSCGVSSGNPGPSYLSGIARCRQTTSCKHQSGFGFKRGGYVCVCKAGTRYPWHLDPPYLGSEIEQATEEEYQSGFMCEKNNYRLALPIIDQIQGVSIEGGGVISNSWGLGADAANKDRQKRSPESNGSDSNGVSDVEQFPNTGEKDEILYFPSSDNVQEFLYNDKLNRLLLEQMRQGAPRVSDIQFVNNNYSMEEVMELANSLREFQDKGKIKKMNIFEDKNSGIMEANEDDYAERNNVDFEIEKLYEEDMKKHRSYKKMLSESMVSGNASITRQALRDNIVELRDRHTGRFLKDKKRLGANRRHKRQAIFDQQSFDKMMRIIRQKASVTSSNCHKLPNHQLYLPGSVGYGVKEQFENEGRTALRLTHFLSMYLQNVMPDENFGNRRSGGRLHMEHMFGEVLANVMGNFRIYSAGLYFDRYKFENQDGSAREFFGPWAYRKSGAYYAMDTAGLSTYYTDEDWFTQAKSRFAANFVGLKTFKIRAYVRSNSNGTSSVRHEYFPLLYRAAPYEVGYWTRPHFRCDGNVDAWVMTYITPFFGLDSLRTKLEFRGVATVDVPLNLLEINQCPQPFSVANAFKNTARCDYFSTICRPQAGFPFLRGSYTCKCRLGFEYWHADGKEWFEGSFVELEYEKKKAGIFSRFDLLNCRPSSTQAVMASWMALFTTLLANLL